MVRSASFILCLGAACVFGLNSYLLHVVRAGVLSAANPPAASGAALGATSTGGHVGAPELGFAVIGFEKTGTTFLLEALGNHPEIVMPPKHSDTSKRVCSHKEGFKDDLRHWLRAASSASSPTAMKYGIKCSDLIRKTLAIEKMASMYDGTRLIVGVRHPVLWFQSNFNYRVLLAHYTNNTDNIPSPHKLHGVGGWQGVSTVTAQFDTYLMQLAKVPLQEDEMQQMKANLRPDRMRVSRNPFKVLIYTIEQLEDRNVTRRTQFERDMQRFLGLKAPLKSFASETKSNVNSARHPEYIDICEQRYKGIRDVLTGHGKNASAWIRKKFLSSKDVVVSNREFFEATLRAWGEDPCGEIKDKGSR